MSIAVSVNSTISKTSQIKQNEEVTTPNTTEEPEDPVEPKDPVELEESAEPAVLDTPSEPSSVIKIKPLVSNSAIPTTASVIAPVVNGTYKDRIRLVLGGNKKSSQDDIVSQVKQVSQVNRVKYVNPPPISNNVISDNIMKELAYSDTSEDLEDLEDLDEPEGPEGPEGFEGQEGQEGLEEPYFEDDDVDDIGVEEPIIASKRHESRYDLLVQKRSELTKLERLAAKGYTPCKKFTMMDSLDAIREECRRLQSQRNIDNSIKWQRKIMMGAVTGIEYLNKTYNPFDIQLDGWSEAVYENIDDYNEIFEELYFKYKDKVQLEPEVRLLGMLCGSAIMFHFSKSLFQKANHQVPGFDQVMNANPHLKQAYQEAAMKTMGATPSNLGNMAGQFLGNAQMGNMVGNLLNSQKKTSVAKPVLTKEEKEVLKNVTMSGPEVDDPDLQDSIDEILEENTENSPAVKSTISNLGNGKVKLSFE